MRNHKHSPPPWREDGELILAADDTAILTLDPYGVQDEETLYANGYLVRGSPTLLEAAEGMLEVLGPVALRIHPEWSQRVLELRSAVGGCKVKRP